MSPHAPEPCSTCGHDPACGYASVTNTLDGVERWYCHDDEHSCYESHQDGSVVFYSSDAFLRSLAERPAFAPLLPDPEENPHE